MDNGAGWPLSAAVLHPVSIARYPLHSTHEHTTLYFIKRVNYHYDDKTFSPSYGKIDYQRAAGDKQTAERRLLQMELREYQTAYGTEKFDQVLRQNTSEEEREKYLSALNAFSLEQFGYIFVKKR